MRKERVLYLFIFVLIAGAGWTGWRAHTSDTTAMEQAACRTVLPRATSFSHKTGQPPHYKGHAVNATTTTKDLIGIAFVTTDAAPDIQGYAGPIRIMAGIDTNGTIQGLQILEHAETPSYVRDLNGFLNQFLQKNVTAPLKLNDQIDGISRATVTSSAITRALDQGGKSVAQNILSLDITEQATTRSPFPYDQIIIPILLFGAAIIAFLRQNRNLRWVVFVGSLIYLGLIKSTMISAVQFANIGLGRWPVWADNPLWYVLLILTGITCPLWGMIYCGNICPFGALQEIIHALTRKVIPREMIISAPLDHKARGLKYIILLTTLIASFVVGTAHPAAVEPYLYLFNTNATTLGWILIGVVLIVSAFHFRFWCTYFCPVGALTGLIARYSRYKIRLRPGCSGCASCRDICPTRAITMAKNDQPIIDDAECVLCQKCMTHCPENTLAIEKAEHASS